MQVSTLGGYETLTVAKLKILVYLKPLDTILQDNFNKVKKETYISLCPQELNTWKRIGYEHFCEELFVVKSKHKYSCASAVYFNLEEEIKQNCEFKFYFNKTDITPSVLDGGHQIVLANWPNYKRIICTHNNNIPVNIPSHPICSFG